MQQRFFDLPESIILQLFQYLIGPNYYYHGYTLMLVNKLMKLFINKFIKQEIRHYHHSRHHYNIPNQSHPQPQPQPHHHHHNQSPNYFALLFEEYEDDTQWTLLLYDCIFSGNIYLIGGIQDMRRCDVFNTYTGKYKRICGVGNKRSEEFDVISYQGHLLVISGVDESSMGNIEIYDLFSNSWYPFPSLPKKLVAPSSIVCQHRLYVTGGVERTSASRSNIIYELIHDQSVFKLGKKAGGGSGSTNDLSQQQKKMQVFSKCAWEISSFSLLLGRSHHSIANYQNLLWIAGGIVTGQWIATNSVEILNPITGQSIPGPSMLRNRLQPKLLVIDDCLYAVGGDMEGTVRSISSIERYENSKPGWMFVTFFHEPRRRSKCAITAYDHKIYVFGGSSDGGNTLSSWDYYNTRTKVWASQIKSYLQEGLIPSRPLTINGIIIPMEEVQYLTTTDLTTIPVRPNGLKAGLALPVTFE